MIAIVGILFLAAVVAGVLILQVTRRWVLEEAATEARLTDPATHTFSYLVPNGQDPAALMAALAHAGFATAIDAHGGTERLLVACEEPDREQIRQLLVDAGSARSATATPVTFEDEQSTAG